MKIPPDLAQTLAAVVDEGGMDRAAVRLGVTQPAVSQRIRALENLVGQALLVRDRPPRATAAGEVVVRLARQLTHVEAEAAARLGIGDAGSRAPLSIAVTSDSLGTWVLPALISVSERLPVVFDLHRDDQDFTVGLLESGTVMAAITSRRDPIAGCAVTPLGAMVYRPMASASFHRRWFPDGVTVAALERAPLVDYDRRDDLQTRWLVQRGVDPLRPPRHRVPSTNDFASAVLGGLGWGQVLPFQADAAEAAGELIPLDASSVRVPLYWQQWNVRSAVLDQVAAEVRSHARRALAATTPDTYAGTTPTDKESS